MIVGIARASCSRYPNAAATSANGAQGVFNFLKFASSCARDFDLCYPIPMFKQGTDLYRLDTDTQQIMCGNPTDDEALVVYFACSGNHIAVAAAAGAIFGGVIVGVVARKVLLSVTSQQNRSKIWSSA